MKKLLSFKNLALVGLLAVSFVFAQVFSVYAQSTGLQQGGNLNNGNFNFVVTCNTTKYNVHGKLWSSTIGWIYLNCADYNNGSGNDFGVIQDGAGMWNGYGWSSSIGWIKFGNGYGTSPVECPSGAVPAANASGCGVQHLANSGTGAPIVGWARACVAAPDPVGCLGAGANPSAGGWDGYISMSGLNDQYPGSPSLQANPGAYGAQLSFYINPQTGHQAISNEFVWGSDVVGWAKFQGAYVDTTIQVTPVAHLTLTANPTTVAGSNKTTLTYSINANDKQLFTGGNCTATSTPAAGAPWDGSKPNYSASSGILVPNTTPASTPTSTVINNVPVPSAPGSSTTYTITCPTNINNTPGTVTASTTVTKQGDQITLSIGVHDLCVASAQGGPQTTSAAWTSSSGGDHVRMFMDGAQIGGLQAPIGSVPVGPFTSSTSNYTTPTQSGQQHEYYARLYDASDNMIAESNHEFVGAAPATYQGPTANGTIDCTTPQWGINLGGGGIACPGDPASLTWASFGTLPAGPGAPSYAKLALSTAGANGPYATTIGGVNGYGLSDTESNVFLAGWYKVIYYNSSNQPLSVTSGPVQVTLSSSNNCSQYQFSGITNGGPYCPASTINQSAQLPKSYGWSSNAANCTLTGPQSGSGPNGTITLNDVSDLGTYSLNCTWTDGTHVGSQATYNPMALSTSQFCSVDTAPGGYPKVIEH